MPEELTIQKSSSGKQGTCWNCSRNKFIAGDGLCGSCLKAVRDLKKDTPEYAAALAEAKERLNNPNFKRGGNRRKTMNPPYIPDLKVQEADSQQSASAFSSEKIISETPTTKQRTEMPIRGTSPLWDAYAGMSLVIDKLRAERDLHLTMVEKIDEAIEILQS